MNTNNQRTYDTKEQLRERMMQDTNYRAFVESGDHRKCAKLISMAYVMNSIVNEYMDDAVSIMEKYDMVHKKIKTTMNNLSQSFDSMEKTIRTLICDDEARKELCNDYGILKGTCDRFMNADERISATDAMQRDDIRPAGMYLCRVTGAVGTDILLLKWTGSEWMQHNSIAGWVGMAGTGITEVTERL